MRSTRNTLILTLVLGEIYVGTTLWKSVPHKMVRPTWVSPNKRVSVRESVRKRLSLAFLIQYYANKENSQ